MELRDNFQLEQEGGYEVSIVYAFCSFETSFEPTKVLLWISFLFQRRKPIELLRIWRLKYEGLRFVEINEALFEIVIKV